MKTSSVMTSNSYKQLVLRTKQFIKCSECDESILPRFYERHVKEKHDYTEKQRCIWCLEYIWKKQDPTTNNFAHRIQCLKKRLNADPFHENTTCDGSLRKVCRDDWLPWSGFSVACIFCLLAVPIEDYISHVETNHNQFIQPKNCIICNSTTSRNHLKTCILRRALGEPGCVYIISNCDLQYRNIYKIGFTTNLELRIRCISTNSPFPFHIVRKYDTLKYRALERTLHTQFSNTRMNGEFFILTLNDIQVCDEIFEKMMSRNDELK